MDVPVGLLSYWQLVIWDWGKGAGIGGWGDFEGAGGSKKRQGEIFQPARIASCQDMFSFLGFYPARSCKRVLGVLAVKKIPTTAPPCCPKNSQDNSKIRGGSLQDVCGITKDVGKPAPA
jgi:hypothetical protein